MFWPGQFQFVIVHRIRATYDGAVPVRHAALLSRDQQFIESTAVGLYIPSIRLTNASVAIMSGRDDQRSNSNGSSNGGGTRVTLESLLELESLCEDAINTVRRRNATGSANRSK